LIDPRTRVGAVRLTVGDLGRSLEWYDRATGLDLVEQAPGFARLGAGGHTLVELAEIPGAPPSRGHTGLFHFALLFPERVDLARWLDHAAQMRVPLSGASDHFVSEAVYLRDPDGHGIELYADRPREVWEGRIEQMGTTRLDVDDLLSTLEPGTAPFERLPAGTTMGHVHLCVADLDDARRFYRDVVGFDLVAEIPGQAVFVSAGGYHHHFGANVWESRGAPPPPPGSAALQHATIVLPDADAREGLLARVEAAGLPVGELEGMPAVRDPSANLLVLDVAG